VRESSQPAALLSAARSAILRIRVRVGSLLPAELLSAARFAISPIPVRVESSLPTELLSAARGAILQICVLASCACLPALCLLFALLLLVCFIVFVCLPRAFYFCLLVICAWIRSCDAWISVPAASLERHSNMVFTLCAFSVASLFGLLFILIF